MHHARRPSRTRHLESAPCGTCPPPNLSRANPAERDPNPETPNPTPCNRAPGNLHERLGGRCPRPHLTRIQPRARPEPQTPQRPNPHQEVFTDKAFGKCGSWEMSTSNLSHERMEAWGFGEVMEQVAPRTPVDSIEAPMNERTSLVINTRFLCGAMILNPTTPKPEPDTPQTQT